ncbi:MAG: DUF523 domain-containing protein [Ruminococcaceae bacterium]|nr:DUF523 domain-containing protein [Oscillospiraceae bacterium]
MNIIVSACLLGTPCRYDGKSKPCESVIALKERHNLIPVCPEVLGGLEIPRTPCEIVGDKVISKNGEDRTTEYQKGAEKALEIALKNGCKYAVLKHKSPACSPDGVYDGSFTGRLVDGMGVAARLLSQNKIKVLYEDELYLISEDEL